MPKGSPCVVPSCNVTVCLSTKSGLPLLYVAITGNDCAGQILYVSESNLSVQAVECIADIYQQGSFSPSILKGCIHRMNCSFDPQDLFCTVGCSLPPLGGLQMVDMIALPKIGLRVSATPIGCNPGFRSELSTCT